MTENETKLYNSLERIVSYYDVTERGYRAMSMDDQAKAKHENTMFGEARKVLKEIKELRIVTSSEGNGKPAARTPEKCDATNSGTGAD